MHKLCKQLEGYEAELTQLKTINSAGSSDKTDWEKILREDLQLSSNSEQDN